MVCSACGYENQAGMRFCGMCGTPLPHRPLTTPGAQSTLGMTRVPLEGGSLSADHTISNSSSRAGILDIPGWSRSDAGDVPPSDGRPGASDAAEIIASQQASTIEPPSPAKELVPDVPLHEYLQSFHYEPPQDSDEKTMRGDATMLDAAAPVVPAPASPMANATSDSAPLIVEQPITEPTAISAENPDSSKVMAESEPSTEVLPVTPADSVVSRLGLEPQGPAETPVERPRFLDIHEPAKDNKPTPSSGTSTIVGPSFLGLSDPPAAVDEPKPFDAEEPARSHWRMWVAVAVAAVFATLGVIEWRSQVNQTDNGPVEVMKAKIRDWRHRATTQPSQTAPLASTDSNAKPDMQVAEQPKPSTAIPSTSGGQTGSPNNPGGSSANSSTATSAPGTNPPTVATTAPPASTTTAGKPSAVPASPKTTKPGDQPTTAPGNTASNPLATSQKNVASGATAATSSSKPKPDRSAETSDENAPAQETPGAEEMAKAKNASDTPAQAAWLWKATAKGNLDAPVQLADMYVKGSGVPRSCEQAMVLLKTAAEKENALARNRLAAMYSTGNCVQRNRVEAYHWLSSALAANPNSQWAQQNRDLIWQQMTPGERAAAAKYR